MLYRSLSSVVGDTVISKMRISRYLTITVVILLGCAKSAKDRQQNASHGTNTFAESKLDTASLTVKKYAYEAYPSWAIAHPDTSCPDRLEDLNEYMNTKDTKDPWGGNYRMMCGPNLPAGARGLAVMSPGEDGKEGTADDVKSWD